MRLSDAIASIANGDADVIDVTDLASDADATVNPGVDVAYERQVALG